MTESNTTDVDVVIVGAGFAGMYQLVRMRRAGLSAVVLEAGRRRRRHLVLEPLPGRPLRHPHRRLLLQLGPRTPGGVDLVGALRHPARDPPLRPVRRRQARPASRHPIQHPRRRPPTGTTTPIAGRSTPTRAPTSPAKFYVMATGCLSMPKVPDIEGTDRFAGEVYFTNSWPHDGVDFTGKRVAVIGTGSSGIQSIPIIASQADQLTVFQRTPNFSIPAHNGPITDERLAEYRKDPAAYREEARHSGIGVPRTPPDTSALRRVRRGASGRVRGGVAARRTGVPAAVQRHGRQRRGERHDAPLHPRQDPLDRRRPRRRRGAVPDQPLLRHQATLPRHRLLRDVQPPARPPRRPPRHSRSRRSPSPASTVRVEAGDESMEFDAIVFATGFDAMTGAIVGVDITGRDGESFREAWAHGPQTYLGLMTVGFPNLFMITGPGSPSVLSNMMVSIEQHVDLITDTIDHLRADRLRHDRADRARCSGGGCSTATRSPTSPCCPPRTRGTWAPTCPASRRCSCPIPAASAATARSATRWSQHGYLGFTLAGDDTTQTNDGVIRPLKPDVQAMLSMMADLELPPLETMGVEGARAVHGSVGRRRCRPGPTSARSSTARSRAPTAPRSSTACTDRRPTAPTRSWPTTTAAAGCSAAPRPTTRCAATCASTRTRSSCRSTTATPPRPASLRLPTTASPRPHGSPTTQRNSAAFRVSSPSPGWSAGANVAAVTAQQAKLAGAPTIVGQVLLCPVTDGTTERPHTPRTPTATRSPWA